MDLAASGSRTHKRLDDLTIQLEEEENDTNMLHAQRTLVGKVLSDRSLNRGAIKNILSKAWGDPEGLQISDVSMNVFMFIFKHKEEAHEVIRKGPWYVMGKLVSLQQWSHQAVMKEMDFSKVGFWIQVHGLPVEYMKVKNAETILNQMGEVEEIEDMMVEEQLVRFFVRARVSIKVSQPLSTGCWVPRRNLPKVWVSIKYEKLHDLCFKCGVIGHDQRGCKGEREMSVTKGDLPKYGAYLSVPPAKELKLIIEERRKWKQRNSASAGQQGTRETTNQNEEPIANQGALVVRNQVEVRNVDREEGQIPPLAMLEEWVEMVLCSICLSLI